MTPIRLTYLLALLLALPAQAETLVAARIIRSQAIIVPADLALIEKSVPGALSNAGAVLGMAARVMLYAGRPIHPGDIGPPTLVDRNQIVTLIFVRAGLIIRTEARAMGRGGLGDAVRVMNLASRTMVSGVVMADGTVHVGAPATALRGGQ